MADARQIGEAALPGVMAPRADEIPAITLWQPWATMIAWGWKRIETRFHDRFRGLFGQRIVIHAGLRTDSRAMGEIDYYLAKPRSDRALAQHWRGWLTGVIVCTAKVVEARWLAEEDSPAALIDCSEMSPARFGLVLDSVRPVDPPVAISGHQGVWYVRRDRIEDT